MGMDVTERRPTYEQNDTEERERVRYGICILERKETEIAVSASR